MGKKFLSEREGQLQFFADLKISTDVELSHNTDGVYKGTLFEFKLTISDINKVLFQAIKYLSHRRVKGESIPAQILLVALNEQISYLFNSEKFLEHIEQIYAGAASKNNADFNTKIKPEKIDYSSLKGLNRLTEILDVEKYTKIHIDVFDVVGWANRYYSENPLASKIKLFKELRSPKHLEKYIYPWMGDVKEFQYIMDLLNDKQQKKDLGAFYTPPPYSLKATELVRKAIKKIPKGNDYIILDRCAGTGNLEEFLTDKAVKDITIGELDQYIDKSLKAKYLKDKADIITTFFSKRIFSEVTVGDLEKHRTKISLYDYVFDNELSHTIVNTFELKEWIVLNERFGDRVNLIIPPPQEVDNKMALVEGGDALSSQFITGKISSGMTSEYSRSIKTLLDYVKNSKTNIILYENPPFRDTASNSHTLATKGYTSFVKEQLRGELKGPAINDLSNLFISSAYKYYLKKPDDYYILFSPIKYWKALNLGEHKFIDGYIFNREHFHAGAAAISCILWQNLVESKKELVLQSFDINTQDEQDIKDQNILSLEKVKIKKTFNLISKLYEKYNETIIDHSGVLLELDGKESKKPYKNASIKPVFNEQVLGYLVSREFGFDHPRLATTLVRCGLYDGHGFFIHTKNYFEKLPLFAAGKYDSGTRWWERGTIFKTSDMGDAYVKDADLLKSCLIFTCLSYFNKCRSFVGTDKRLYKNELCFEKGTLATKKISSYKLTKEEQDLMDTFFDVLTLAKSTKKYNKKFTYGTYQIDDELNTRYKNENDEWVYDYPELYTVINSLKTKLLKYYENNIVPKLFRYELLK